MRSLRADAIADDASAKTGRAALLTFGALEAAALAFMLERAHRMWFGPDDWDFFRLRKLGSVKDLIRSHFGHWTTLPIVAYRIVWSFVGLRSYTPYLMLAVAAHLAVCALLRVVMLRAGVNPWLATFGAAILLFFGAGAENVLVAFQVAFGAALAFGFGQLLLADHDGFDRRDWFGLGCGLCALMCSGVGVTMVLVVGIAALLRRGWGAAAFHAVPLAFVYAIWLIAAPPGRSAGLYATSIGGVARFSAIELGVMFARLGQLPTVGIFLAVVLVVGFARNAIRGNVLALLAGAVMFVVMTGITRSGVKLSARAHLELSARAHLERYSYVAVALILPALIVAVSALIRSWPRFTVLFVAVLAVGIPGNIAQFGTYAATNVNSSLAKGVLAAVHNPVADRVRPVALYPFLARGLTIGWLLDNGARHGPTYPMTPAQIAAETKALLLMNAQQSAARRQPAQ